MNPDRAQYWERRLALQSEEATQPIRAVTAERSLRGRCKGVVFLCEDDRLYAVKGHQVGRPLVAERIVGLLANLVGFPVPSTRLIEIPVDLCDYEESYCSHFEPGLAHGSLWIEECRHYDDVRWPDDPGNRERFSDLAILYSATLSADHQFLYQKTYPHTVWSHDHGPYLDIESEWDDRLLRYYLDGSFAIDARILGSALCTKAHLRTSAGRIEEISDEQIASVIGSVPLSWGISEQERIVLCEFLRHSRDKVVALVQASAA